MTRELLDILQSDIYTDDAEYADRVRSIREWAALQQMASPELIEEARELHARQSGDDIEVDEEALISASENGTWVAGWLWVADSDLCPHGECRGDCTECAKRTL
jgi:hypothetical protein